MRREYKGASVIRLIASTYRQRVYTLISKPFRFLEIRENLAQMWQVNYAHESEDHPEVMASLGGDRASNK